VTLAVLIASFGDEHWRELAARARESARRADEILTSHEPVGPIEDVRNAMVERTKADWLCFLDADDELGDDFLREMEHALYGESGILANDRARLLAPAVEYVYPDGPGEQLYTRRPPAIPNKHHPMPPLNHCVVATVVSRRMFNLAGGFIADYWPWSDYELWLRCCRHGARVVEVPDAVYRVHVNTASDNNTLSARAGAALGERIHNEHREHGGSFPVEGGERG
jgi:glycosyltransferase involved in cell wall biosynthesis